MESLLNRYDAILKSEQWKYYDSPADISIFNTDMGRSFINRYLREGDKTEIPIFKYIDLLEVNRINHIISCFLLGVILYDGENFFTKCVNDFLSRIPTNRNESIWERFLYIWMLVSLFHDFGYAIESGKEPLEEDLFMLIRRMPNKFRGVPKLYSKKVIEKYSLYRNCRYRCYDHGVVGGAKLYHDLYLLRNEKEKDYIKRNLYWGKDIEFDFAIAAWAIVCHNVFYIKETDRYSKCYKEFGLEELIYDNHARKIKLKNHPIFFLLCLVDSIEPLKTFSDLYMLENIEIDVFQKKVAICLNTNDSNMCMARLYISRAVGLSEWFTDTDFNDDVLIIHID